MTDRQRQMIEFYLPNPRDPELEPMEYYVEDMRGRAVKVHIQDIAANRDGVAIHQVRTDSGRLVHGPWETEPDLIGGGWYTMANMYDNRLDCINSEHSMCNEWEQLRELQLKEADG
jgi:hypothetical protein